MEDTLTTRAGETVTTTVVITDPIRIPTGEVPSEIDAKPTLKDVMQQYADARADSQNAKRAMYAWEAREKQLGALIRAFLAKQGFDTETLQSLAFEAPDGPF